MRVLIIGQLPKEIGGNYTTGVANVVYELSRHPVDGIIYYTYGTNIKDSIAEAHSSYDSQYIGYKIRPFHILSNILLHPFTRIKEWKHYKKVYHDNPLRFEIYRDNFSRIIKLVQPDIINVHGSTSICPLNSVNQLYNIPLVQTFHGISDSDDEESRKIRPQNIDEAQMADFVTVLTQNIKEFVNEKLKVNNEKIQVIPNGCDINKFFFSKDERYLLRKQIGINDTTTVFVTASSVIRRKGQWDFIKVVEKLNIDCQYWVIGKGPDFDNCLNYCQEHHLQDKVIFLGYVDNSELYKYYSAADVFVHASYREAQALCEIEAYACGMKIILNKEIKHTVATDTSNSDIYYIMDFNNTDLPSLAIWSEKKIQRVSRKDKDWKNVVNEYNTYFNKIIKQWSI